MTQITLLPRPDDLPDFSDALTHLEEVPTILFQALEHAAYETSVFKKKASPKKRLDAGLAASLFRFYAIDYLNAHGIHARADAWKWTFNTLPFLGISFYYNNYHVRVLKGPGGALPGCGVSRRKKRFFRQLPTNYLIGPNPQRSIANLVVLWDLTAMYDLAGLWLALPAEGGLLQQDVSAYWISPLSHPALSSQPALDDTEDGGLGTLIEKPNTEERKEEDDRRASSTS